MDTFSFSPVSPHFVLNKPVPVHVVNDPMLEDAGISLSVLRCDLIHPLLSGNKWYKLKHNISAAQKQGTSTLLSFGGAWSNHIHALAAAGKVFGFSTIGVIRGDASQGLNPCLSDAVANSMSLHWVSREDYRQKEDEKFIAKLQEKFGEFFLIPEGGANRSGVEGCREILNAELVKEYDQVCLACGTGATLTGVLSAACPTVLGFQVLKGKGYLKQEVNKLLNQYHLKAMNQWSMNDDYHFEGYGKTTPELMRFIADFQEKTNIPLEPVYSGKMLFGIYDLVKQGYFKKGSKILAIHGGGLQGARGFTC